MNARLVFMGSPEFALPSLQALAHNFQVVGVVTQPDRPAGRGREITPPPVKSLARNLDIPTIQPNRLKETRAMEQLQDWRPDLIVVAAFGQILRPEVLDLPPHGCVNVHASLLPRWRGAAPIQAAIMHGDHQTGITIMKMDPGLDTGPILHQRGILIEPEDTAAALNRKLSELGAELLLDTLPAYLRGEITPTPQDDDLATYAPMLKKEDGRLDFNRPVEELQRKVRAFNPWPGAFTTWLGRMLKIHRAQAVSIKSELRPGTLTVHTGLPAVAAIGGLLVLEEVQPEGKRAMDGAAFLQGARDWDLRER
jgi:methionyl-tRNA formyltransferase